MVLWMFEKLATITSCQPVMLPRVKVSVSYYGFPTMSKQLFQTVPSTWRFVRSWCCFLCARINGYWQHPLQVFLFWGRSRAAECATFSNEGSEDGRRRDNTGNGRLFKAPIENWKCFLEDWQLLHNCYWLRYRTKSKDFVRKPQYNDRLNVIRIWE